MLISALRSRLPIELLAGRENINNNNVKNSQIQFLFNCFLSFSVMINLTLNGGYDWYWWKWPAAYL